MNGFFKIWEKECCWFYENVIYFLTILSRRSAQNLEMTEKLLLLKKYR